MNVCDDGRCLLDERNSGVYAGLWKWDNHVKMRLASASLDDSDEQQP